jgi:FkbM family methyltransferase
MRVSAISGNSSLGKLARWPLSLVPKTLVAPILTGKTRGSRWIVGSSRYACWLGFYEQDKQRLISESVKPDSVFYDVGANVGFYSLLAARLVEGGKVFAFEPAPRNLAYLREHLRLNNVANTEVIAAAIADREGESAFTLESTGFMGHLSNEGDISVSTTSLDFLLEQGRILPPQYIKMDIEGAELTALQGAQKCIQQYRPQIFLATHGQKVHSQCCRLLESWGFECRILELTADGFGEVVATSRRPGPFGRIEESQRDPLAI